MRKFILFICILTGGGAWGQDTLTFTNRREVSDIIFGLLNPQLYNGVLIDRSFSTDSILFEQVRGDYSRIPTGADWLNLHSSLSVSYIDSSYMPGVQSVISGYSDFLLVNEFIDDGEDVNERIVLPFALLFHRVTYLDSNFASPNYFSNVSSQLKLNSSVNEADIYKRSLIKCASNLDLTGDHGYTEGKILFDPNFISTSPDIEMLSIRLNLGNGFLPFDAQNNVVDYYLSEDYQKALAAVEYKMDNFIFQDTLPFFLTTRLYEYKDISKSNRWDKETDWDGTNDVEFRVGIRYGCGNGTKIRRPVIIAPPYRPSTQPVSMNKYYDQFDFKSLFSSLTDMGYDVIFLKEQPGNGSIEDAGASLAWVIRHVNSMKSDNYPDENWENIVIGFSAGGQHWRYALKLLEKEHMDDATKPHHHTRLYIPFDSPHWGANIPFFAQAVYRQQSGTNPMAAMTYASVIDEGSKDMLMYHILTNSFNTDVNNEYTYTPAPSSERVALVDALMNNFNHQFTPLNDLRRSFPSFTRNVAISTGSNSKDYEDEYGLTSGMTLFEQHTSLPSAFPPGWATKHRVLSASSYGSAANNYWGPAFLLDQFYTVLFLVPVWQKDHYYTYKMPEFDKAQGGYKDEFYDKNALGVLPVSPVPLLRWTAWGFGQKHYNKHMNFLPTVSSLAINPNFWQNNNLKYDLKANGLMFQKFDVQNNPASEFYGYPHLSHPNDHFDITPFESVYCDPQTYEHIKMQASIGENQLNDEYLVYLRNFILDEVESDDVFLQNKTIGKNHQQSTTYYKYRAWYRAHDHLTIGNQVTPKTDPGDYIIEQTGDITVYAAKSVSIKPGFHAQAGSDFHAYIEEADCTRPRSADVSNAGADDLYEEEKPVNGNSLTVFAKFDEEEVKIFPNPSNGEIQIVLPKNQNSADYVIYSLQGSQLEKGNLPENKSALRLNYPRGTYIIQVTGSNSHQFVKRINIL